MTSPRTVTMEQAQNEALVLGVDDDGKFYGETADGERLEIAEDEAVEPDAWTADELLSECRCIRSLLPDPKAEVNIAVSSDTPRRLCVSVYPGGLIAGGAEHFYNATTITEAFSQARAWCATYKERRRADAERRLAEAQAALAALDAEA